MAAVEIPTTSFRDFSTSAYGNQGLELDEVAAFTTLVNGSGNGVKFEFASAGFMIFYNAGGTTVTFTIKLDEPDEYDAWHYVCRQGDYCCRWRKAFAAS